MGKLTTGKLIKIKGSIQYYCDKKQEIVTDSNFVGKQALVVEPNSVGTLAKIKLAGLTGAYIHPKNADVDIISTEQQWMSKGSIVKINGLVSTKDHSRRYWGGSWGQPKTSPDDGGWMEPPGKSCTDRFVGKLAEILYVGKGETWYKSDSEFVELKIKGKRGATYYAVAWPSSIEPIFTI